MITSGGSDSATKGEQQALGPVSLLSSCLYSGGPPELLSEVIEENPWGYAKRLRFVQEALASEFATVPATSIRVLDVGCGNGAFVAIPLARCGYDVTGIDLHNRSIEHAQRLANVMPNARFFASGVAELESPPFDVVILSEVLEHVPDPKGLLSGTLRHLKPDGIVVVTVPNGYGEFEIDSWIYRTLRLQVGINLFKRIVHVARASSPRKLDQETSAATDNVDCGHIHFFRRRVLKKLFAECSLAVARECAGSFVCGPIVCHALARSRRFVEWNTRVSDKLPLTLVSSWYFVLRRIQQKSLQ
jgi:2-polyprenyl-3-methyl-5-hydroxy-6-metoxy-1,4-benzoquinol methylase